MLIYKHLSRSVNYLSQSCQQSSIQPIRSWYQELVSWNGGINGMSTGSPVSHSLCSRSHALPSPKFFFQTSLGACSQATAVRVSYSHESMQCCLVGEGRVIWKMERIVHSVKGVLGIGEGWNRGEEVTERRLDRDCRSSFFSCLLCNFLFIHLPLQKKCAHN